MVEAQRLTVRAVARPAVRVKTQSVRIGYPKTGRKPPGKPRLVDKLMAKRRAS